ncbi:MAG: dienelactone hydrolase [Burkholderiaceae bacterium]|nr:dienelactone hydrolase [Burkholderiales bacterium]MCZ8096800.1 dienelactone hydrolase [Burkholderiales bacterium]MCZ8340318.1 dienelactone hydrolase [Burkholderiaceae bacterium]
MDTDRTSTLSRPSSSRRLPAPPEAACLPHARPHDAAGRSGPRAVLAALLVGACVAVAPAPAASAEVGWRSLTVPPAADADATQVALWYPTAVPGRTTPMGPFEVRAAIGAPPGPRFAGLALFSHGTGGSELGHARLAEALARRGWLVAALRHPRDNWEDASLLARSPERYFEVRPRQASRVLDALLADPAIAPRIAADAGGPRIAAIGHSAGGYTVLALAGARPDAARIVAHCREHRAEDPLFCATGRAAPPAATSGAPAPAPMQASTPASPDLGDRRVRAAVALAPVGVVLDDASLASIRVPVAVHVPALDRWLAPRFHGARLAAAIPGAVLETVPNAWHFAFLDTPSMPIQSPDGDLRADPPGFDRAAYIAALGPRIADFLEAAMARTAAAAAPR